MLRPYAMWALADRYTSKNDLDDDARFGFGITSADLYYRGVEAVVTICANASETNRCISPWILMS